MVYLVDLYYFLPMKSRLERELSLKVLVEIHHVIWSFFLAKIGVFLDSKHHLGLEKWLLIRDFGVKHFVRVE